MDNSYSFAIGKHPLLVKPGENFVVKLTLPPVKLYMVGLRWTNPMIVKWHNRRARLKWLREVKRYRRAGLPPPIREQAVETEA